MDEDNEIWKDIDGFNGSYQISNKGNVRSLDRIVEYTDGRIAKYKGRVLELFFHPKTGVGVTLCIKRKVSRMSVTRLVWLAFKPKEKLPRNIINIDGDLSNNKVDNLKAKNEKLYYKHKGI